MKKIIFIFNIFFVFLLSTSTFSYAQLQAGSGTLRDLIAEKSDRLKELQEQRNVLEKNLEDVSKSNAKLSKEIKTMDNTIGQLDLLVKSNNLAIEKIELEIESLAGDIENTEKNITSKKETMGKLFSELQQKDKENFLTIFLRNKSLAESVAEVRTISTLNSNFYENLEALKNLQVGLTQKIREGENKKQEKAVEKINFRNRQVILADQKKEKQSVLSQTKNQEFVYEKQLYVNYTGRYESPAFNSFITNSNPQTIKFPTTRRISEKLTPIFCMSQEFILFHHSPICDSFIVLCPISFSPPLEIIG